MSNVLTLSKQLISIASVSPDDNGCIDLLIPRLEKIGFHIEKITAGNATNLWARLGDTAPLLCFAGHTDVVPTGPIEQWTSEPFTPTERDGYLYGRGAADMKTGIAAMIVAIEAYINTHQTFNGSIALLITSAEENYSDFGTPIVIEKLKQRNEQIDYCIIGEPSSSQQLGDTLKNGRRGSLHGDLIVRGKQGHVAYPHLAENPIHTALAALEQLSHTNWDQGNKDFPATSFQISNIHAGSGADNVIPGELNVIFNFRFSPETTVEHLQQSVMDILNEHGLNYTLNWSLSGMPFHCTDKKFIAHCQKAVNDITGLTAKLSTDGGTSDGRFIAQTGAQVIELGVINKTIHQIDESVVIEDLEKLASIYQQIIVNCFK